MKKLLAILMTLVFSASMFTGCTGKAVVESPAANETVGTESTETNANNPSESEMESGTTAEASRVKTGLSVVTQLTGENAAAEKEGAVKTDISFVAVTVDDKGIIESCVIDGVQANITFTADGRLTSTETEFPSKNELGEKYGMKQYSGIRKEWNEQAAAIAEYAVGKTVEELKNGAIDETGKIKDADLASSATIYAGSLISGIEKAVNQAKDLGAKTGDKLVLTSIANPGNSKSAAGQENGLAQVSANIAAVTVNDHVITSCAIDAVQTEASFDQNGGITTELKENVPTKNEMGEEYGLKQYSGIGKEWNEQVASFCEYVKGKTAEEVAGIAVNEKGAPAEADLSSSVTIAIGEFTALIEKAVR